LILCGLFLREGYFGEPGEDKSYARTVYLVFVDCDFSTMPRKFVGFVFFNHVEMLFYVWPMEEFL